MRFLSVCFDWIETYARPKEGSVPTEATACLGFKKEPTFNGLVPSRSIGMNETI